MSQVSASFTFITHILGTCQAKIRVPAAYKLICIMPDGKYVWLGGFCVVGMNGKGIK